MNSPDSTAKPPESLLKLQQQFAGHIRDPEGTGAPEGIEDRRMAIYRRLFFGNLRNLFARNFPVLRRLLDDETWDTLIRAFMRDHRARTPMFTEIGREFVRFLETGKPEGVPRFALELAHWEYLETIVRLHPDDPGEIQADPEGDLLAGRPVLNPTLQLGQYQWPVHEIGPDFQPEEPLDQPLLLAACRRRNDRISFLKLNAVTARLLGLIQEHPDHTGRASLEAIADELGSNYIESVIESGARMLDRLSDSELILGSH